MCTRYSEELKSLLPIMRSFSVDAVMYGRWVMLEA